MDEQIVAGKYRIRELIGEGNMGAVYEAEHVHTGRRCALKLIRSPELVGSEQILGRFEREARAAGVLASRHIAQVMDAGLDPETSQPFMVMEYLEGEDLHELLERAGPLPEALALRIAAQACLGLHKAHEAGVVHRDVKPHNLYLCLEDAGEVVVKLLDFGIAKVKMDQSSTLAGANLTTTGSLIGSPRYMSPEQALGHKDIDRRTDLWSLGAVLYQALSGRGPFDEPETLADLILALTTKSPPPVVDIAPSVRREVATIVHRCLARDPAERFATAEAMLEAMRPLMGDAKQIHVDELVALDGEREAPAAGVGASESAASAGSAATVALSEPASSTTAQGAVPRGTLAQARAKKAALAKTGVTPARSDALEVTAPMAPGDAPTAKLAETVPATPLGAEASSGGRDARGRAAAPMARRWGYLLGAGLAVAAVAGVVALQRREPPSDAAAGASSSLVALPGASSAGGTHDELRAGVRNVQVVIIPSNASVEVDGKAAVLQGSLLTLSGAIGTVYRVRVWQGSSETTADVVISKEGAVPPKIEIVPGQIVRLGAAGSTASASAAAPTAATTVQPEATPKAPTPTPPADLDSDMREFQ